MSAWSRPEANELRDKKEEGKTLQYTGNINDIIDMTVLNGGVAPKNEIPSQEYLPVNLNEEGNTWTIYYPEGIKVWREHGVNVEHSMRMVSFYKNKITIVESEYQTAVLRKGFGAELTDREQQLMREQAEKEARQLDDQKIVQYIRANDLASILLDAAEGRTTREETLTALSAAELPAHKRAEQVVEGANGQANEEVVTVSQLKEVMNGLVEQFARQQNQFLRSLQGPTGQRHGNNPRRNQQNQQNQQNQGQSQQPSPDDFDDDDQNQNQSQSQSQPQDSSYPFTLNSNGCIPGLDKQATAAVIQQYEAAKKRNAADEGGND